MHLFGAGFPQHFNDLPHGIATVDRIIDQHDPLSAGHALHNAQFHVHGFSPLIVGGFDKTAANVCILMEDEAERLALNLMMALLFFLASRIPGVWGESFVEGSETEINRALDNTFGGTWYIILGSSVAFLSSAVLNNFLNYGIGLLMHGKESFGVFALRSYVSTFLGQLADNLIFALIVSRLFFGWTLLQCFTCALTGALLELLFEVLFSPLGYRMSKRILDAREGGNGQEG